MTYFTLATPSANQIWSSKFIPEYTRASTYGDYISPDGDNIIRMCNELTNKKGTLIHVPIIAKLRGAYNNGSSKLVGSEIALNNYSVAFQTTLVRQAVAMEITEQLKTELDLRAIAQTQLKTYAAEYLKNDLINQGFTSVPVANQTAGLEDTVVPYASATTAQLNAYAAANSDRLMFVGGSNTGTMSSSLSSVTSSGTLTAATLSAASDMFDATTNSSIFALNPYQTSDGQAWKVLFVNSVGYRQLRSDPAIFQSTKDALPREKDSENNPLFTGGDLIWDGIIVKKIRDYTTMGAVGGSSATVAQAQLCGLNAVMMGYSMKTKPTILSEDDYQLTAGVGFMEQRGITKASIGGLQTGMVTIFHAS